MLHANCNCQPKLVHRASAIAWRALHVPPAFMALLNPHHGISIAHSAPYIALCNTHSNRQFRSATALASYFTF